MTAHSESSTFLDSFHCPLKIPVRLGRSGATSKTWFLVPTRVQNPNVISMVSAIMHSLPQSVVGRDRARPLPRMG